MSQPRIRPDRRPTTPVTHHLVPGRRRVRLRNAESGLYLYHGELVLVTDYTTDQYRNCYLTNGETFWAAARTPTEHGDLLLYPVHVHFC